MVNPLTFKPKDFARLTAGRNLELDLSVKGRYLYLSTEGSLGNIDRQLVESIITIPGKKLMGQYCQRNVEVTWGTTSRPSLPFTSNTYL